MITNVPFTELCLTWEMHAKHAVMNLPQYNNRKSSVTVTFMEMNPSVLYLMRIEFLLNINSFSSDEIQRCNSSCLRHRNMLKRLQLTQDIKKSKRLQPC